MPSTRLRPSFGLLALLLTAAPLAAQTTIGTQDPGVWTGGTAWGNAGSAGWFTQGQVFEAPSSDHVLQTFSLRYGGQTTTDLLFQVFAWGGSAPSGPALYGEALTFSVTDGQFRQETLSFAPIGGLALSPSTLYAATLSRTGGGTSWGVFRHQGATADSYANGHYIFEASSGWNDQNLLHNADMVFSATFASTGTVTPEPVSMALLGTGLAGLGVVRRRRKRQDAEPA